MLRRYAGVIAGLALVVAGVVLWVVAPGPEPRSFGWFVYSPLEQSPPYEPRPALDDPFGVRWSGWEIVAAGVGVAGVAVTAGAVGYRLGRRRGGPVAGSPADGL